MYSCLAYCCVGSHLGLFWFSWNLGIIIFILSLEWALLFIWAYDCMIFIDSSLVFIMTIILDVILHFTPVSSPGHIWHFFTSYLMGLLGSPFQPALSSWVHGVSMLYHADPLYHGNLLCFISFIFKFFSGNISQEWCPRDRDFLCP